MFWCQPYEHWCSVWNCNKSKCEFEHAESQLKNINEYFNSLPDEKFLEVLKRNGAGEIKDSCESSYVRAVQPTCPKEFEICQEIINELERKKELCQHGGTDDYFDGKYDGIEVAIEAISQLLRKREI